MTIIDGKKVSSELLKEIKQKIETEKLNPKLAVILVGDNPASHTYVNIKQKRGKEIGINVDVIKYPPSVKQEEIINKIRELNNDKDTNGIIVQLPLPEHLNEEEITNTIKPEKDVDGLTFYNLGRLFAGAKPYFLPCTPAGIMKLLDYYNIPLKGKKAVVIGRSNIVGKPVAMLLLSRHATVTICHSRTINLEEEIKQGDIIVAAVGKPEFIKGEYLKKGVVVIDVGINRIKRGDKNILVGDVEFESARSKAEYITPVPGGVGPMTVAMLMHNTIRAFLIQNA